jgi:hypothetical protein
MSKVNVKVKSISIKKEKKALRDVIDSTSTTIKARIEERLLNYLVKLIHDNKLQRGKM